MDRTIVMGLGNPILGDDGVGWAVAEAVKQQLSSRETVDVGCLAAGGLTLMESLAGYQHAILVDAISTRDHAYGTVLSFKLADLPRQATGHLASVHDTTLQNALELGRLMGAQLPERIDIVAVEVETGFVFSEYLSPPVLAAVSEAARTVLVLLAED